MHVYVTLCIEWVFSVLSIDVYLLQAPLAGVPVDGSMVDASATTFACVNMSGTSSFLMFCKSVYISSHSGRIRMTKSRTILIQTVLRPENLFFIC